MQAAEVWAAVADERVRLADDLSSADGVSFDRPSRCGEWTVHQVLAHLVVLAEGTVRSVLLGGMRLSPFPNKAVDLAARRLAAEADPASLVDRLRAAKGGTFVVPGMPPTLALGEVLVHRADLTDATGIPPLAADERVHAVLEAEVKLWFVFGAPRKIRTLRFEPTDGDWHVGPATGPLVSGPAHQLLLAATGRPGIVGLTGPGASVLAA